MYQLVEEASQVLRTPPPVFDFENPAEPPEEIAKKMAETMEKFGGLGLICKSMWPFHIECL